MDIRPPPHSRSMSRKRVSSPKAAKRDAVAFELGRRDKVLLDQLYDHAPTLLIAFKRLCPARQRDSIETGLDHGKHHAVRYFFQGKFDQRRGLGRVIDAGFHGTGMPAEGKQ